MGWNRLVYGGFRLGRVGAGGCSSWFRASDGFRVGFGFASVLLGVCFTWALGLVYGVCCRVFRVDLGYV